MRAVIICGGELVDESFYKPLIKSGDYIISADSGFENARRIGACVDLALGDFDSYPKEKIKANTVYTLPKEKDHTDSFEALLIAIEKGFDDIVFFCATGSRLDHSLCNIFLLKLAYNKDVRLKIINEHNEVFLTDKKTVLEKKENYHLSLLPLTTCSGVTTKNLYYPLSDATLTVDNPIGISNEFTDKYAEVTLTDGLLLVIYAKD